jgi:holo-[acyl-carrier protein] synthase
MDTLGVGIDLVDVHRIEEMIERKADRVIRKLLTESEREYCMSQAIPAQHIAARIAAKEAAYKALQLIPEARGISWQDMEVERASTGAPSILLHGRAADVAKSVGVKTLLVSLSHSNLQAAAVVMAQG